MTKQNFISLAEAVRTHNVIAKHGNASSFTEDHLETLVSFCKQQNPAFMASRWLGYVNGENGPNGGRR